MTDELLIQIVDAALADVERRSGDRLACRPGCAQCCVGAFAINVLDADRLRRGYEELRISDPARAERLRRRVQESVARTATDFPGDTATGALDQSAEGEARFAEFANDEVCPVLDTVTQTCDLYAHRPMTCRVFGPPVRAKSEAGGDEGFGVCELCFVGATPEEIAACELVADPDDLEGTLLRAYRGEDRERRTTVAYALLGAGAIRRNAGEENSRQMT